MMRCGRYGRMTKCDDGWGSAKICVRATADVFSDWIYSYSLYDINTVKFKGSCLGYMYKHIICVCVHIFK